MKRIIRDEACPKCRSIGRDSHKNHLMVFSDGGKYCNRCGYIEKPNGSIKSRTINDDEGDVHLNTLDDINALQSLTVRSRGIPEGVMKMYGVKVEVNTANREPEAVYFPITRQGEIVGYKKRLLAEKEFSVIGNGKHSDLFGQSVVGNGGKLLIITEGEFDCLSVFTMLQEQGKAYKVVSLPFGANTNAVKQHLEWLESFEKIILWFDDDDAGKKTAKETAELLSVGKCFTVNSTGYKDANELLTNGNYNIMQILSNAKPIRPDGIVSAKDVRELLKAGSPKPIARYPFSKLDEMLSGIRSTELITISAGSGLGKSQLLREITYHLIKTTEYNVGLMMMEESVTRSALSLAGLAVDKPLHLLPDVTQEEIDSAFSKILDNDRVFFFDHFGSSEVDYILAKIRYFAKGLGCKFIILDHLSIIVSAQSEGDERKLIDSLMTKLRTLVQELQITIFAVSHMKRPEGNKGHEDGLRTSLGHLRGSAAIAQLSDAVIGLERNQQAESEEERNTTLVRVLKNRFSGSTGEADKLFYDKATGRLKEIMSWEI